MDELQKLQALVARARELKHPDEKIMAGLSTKYDPQLVAQAMGVAQPAQQQPQPQTGFPDGGSGFMGAMVQGATLNLAGQASEKFRQEQAEYAKAHPVRSFSGQVLGGISAAAGLAAVSPWALPAGAIARFLYGAGSGGTSAAAEGGPETSATSRAIRGGVGAVAGGTAALVAPPLARMAGHGVGKLIKPFVDKAGEVAEHNAPLLPADAAAQMAAREAVVPGATVPAMLNPALAPSLRAVGNNPRVALHAQDEAVKRAEMITVKLREVGDEMEKLVKRPDGKEIVAPAGDARQTMVKHAIPVDRNDHTIVSKVQRAREELRYDIKRAKGSLRSELRKDYETLSKWLYQHAEGLEPLDKSYKLLMRMEEEAKLVLKNLRQGMAGNARNKSAGLGSGSPGGSISKFGTFIHAALSPDPKKYGKETAKLLLTPGQVPSKLLNARANLAKPMSPPWKADLLWSGALGRGTAPAAPSLAGLLEDQE